MKRCKRDRHRDKNDGKTVPVRHNKCSKPDSICTIFPDSRSSNSVSTKVALGKTFTTGSSSSPSSELVEERE